MVAKCLSCSMACPAAHLRGRSCRLSLSRAVPLHVLDDPEDNGAVFWARQTWPRWEPTWQQRPRRGPGQAGDLHAALHLRMLPSGDNTVTRFATQEARDDRSRLLRIALEIAADGTWGGRGSGATATWMRPRPVIMAHR
jgi:hypothetical protein